MLERDTFGPLGFGGGAIGNLYAAVSEEVAREAILTARNLGISYFDTAPHYGFGLSEKRLGSMMPQLDSRRPVIISTKVGRKLVASRETDLTACRQGFVTPEPYESE